jgi:hypothetical protein
VGNLFLSIACGYNVVWVRGRLILSSLARFFLLPSSPPPLSSCFFLSQDVTGKNAWGAVIYDEECFATREVVTVGQVRGAALSAQQGVCKVPRAESACKIERGAGLVFVRGDT